MEQVLKTFDLTAIDGWMILITIPAFLLLWWGLKTYLFVPFVGLLEAREAATDGRRDMALRREVEVRGVQDEIESRLRDARIEGNLSRTKHIETARGEAEGILHTAEEDAQELVRNARWQLLQEFDSVRQQSLAEAAPLAESLIQRIIPQGGA